MMAIMSMAVPAASEWDRETIVLGARVPLSINKVMKASGQRDVEVGRWR